MMRRLPLALIAGVTGAPLFVLVLAIAAIGFMSRDVDLSVIAIEMFRTADSALLMAIPLFTFAGFILAESKASERLLEITQSCFSWMPAGLAFVAIIASAFFTAFTGASGVTIVALGALLYPALMQNGYGKPFSLGLVTSSGSLGLLLPPSLPLILYGIIAQQTDAGRGVTIEKLFVAGILPCLVMMVALGLYAAFISRKALTGRTPFNAKRAWRALSKAKWEIPLPFLLFGSIYSGWLAISEIAIMTACYVLIIEVLIYREIHLRHLQNIVVQSMTMVGGILLILSASMALTNYLIDAEVPTHLLNLISTFVSSPLVFLLLLNLFLLALGVLLDVFSALVILTPLLLPLALQFGIDPVHLGIVLLANLQIGYMTPPIGMNLFIASARFNTPMTELIRVTLPFIGILLVCLAIITYVPALSLAPIKWFNF